MKKFVFRYDSILSKYQMDEDDLRNNLYKEQKMLQKLMLDKQHCLNNQHEFESSFSKSLIDGISVSEYKLYDNAKHHYRQSVEKLDMEISEVSLEVARLKELVLGAMKKRKTMESLKEKDYELFLENIKIEENKTIEEIVNYKSYQKGGRS